MFDAQILRTSRRIEGNRADSAAPRCSQLAKLRCESNDLTVSRKARRHWHDLCGIAGRKQLDACNSGWQNA
jgi:hypothetical protein